MKQVQHFIVPENLEGETLTIRDQALLHQMLKVLRLRAGDSFFVLDGRGRRARAVLKSIGKKEALLSLTELETRQEKKGGSARLFVALSKKPSTFEWIVEKSTELGVTEIVPLVTERCQVQELRKTERLESIMKEAVEQSEQWFLPELRPVLSLKELLKNPPNGLLLVGEPWKSQMKLKDLKIPAGIDVNLVIGPEGGLSDLELAELEKIGAKIFVLGDSVLRMETAAVASLAIVLYEKL